MGKRETAHWVRSGLRILNWFNLRSREGGVYYLLVSSKLQLSNIYVMIKITGYIIWIITLAKYLKKFFIQYLCTSNVNVSYCMSNIMSNLLHNLIVGWTFIHDLCLLISTLSDDKKWPSYLEREMLKLIK